ncbi:MAG: peptidase prepilin type [Klenkia sp.]|nr:peptidase prepilin type [Klenkia sp.]
MTALLVGVCVVLGGVVGVVLHRLLERRWARSAIPAGEPGTRRDRAVGPLSVAGATAGLFGLTALWTGPRSDLPAFLVLAAAAVLLVLVDVRHHLLPNLVIGPAFVGGGVLLLVSALVDGSWPDLGRALAGAVVLAGGSLLLALVSPAGLGMGDVKLAGLLGLYLGWVGWGSVLTGVLAAFAVQALLAVTLLGARRVGREGELPFGPALIVGAGFALVAGNVLLSGTS